MNDPVGAHWQEVTQRIHAVRTQGGWEGSHTDFKRELGSERRDIAKLLKHILAFANTPRRTDAYIIFGVSEDKTRNVFEHLGVENHGFPTAERILDIIRHYTTLKDVEVEARHVVDGKRTPYIAIPIQYEGPYTLIDRFDGAAGSIEVNRIYTRYGSSSDHASERDIRRMQSDWGSWFLDYRYAKNASSLMSSLAKRFPTHRGLEDKGEYVRLLYDSTANDEFGTHEVPVMVHAYWDFIPVDPKAIETITMDSPGSAFRRVLVGARFAPTTSTLAAPAIRCISLDEVYFVNDPYAQFCREFLRVWEEERSTIYRGPIVDLDFRLSKKSHIEQSVLAFVEEQLKASGRKVVLVHGDFGCGKTTSAKQVVAYLCQDYLRGHSGLPKAIYVNVNNIDIRSTRDHCIAAELGHYRLSREQIDTLVNLVREDKIQIVFDGVDEMARPYSAEGRKDAIEILRDIGNRRAAAYFVRSSYYPRPEEMLEQFSSVADHDFRAKQKRIIAAEIMSLRAGQITSYLESRLGLSEAKTVNDELKKMELDTFLVDPLIVSLVAELVEKDGIAAIETFPKKNQKAHFLGVIVEKLLDREQVKRKQHGALANFALFQKVLHAVAFGMICKGSSTISPTQLEASVRKALERHETTPDATDAFRTMSWIRCSDDGTLNFRHEALTLVCAAEHICTALELQDAFALADWQAASPKADMVCRFAGEIIGAAGILGGTALLGGEMQFNVQQLIKAVFEGAKARTEIKNPSADYIRQLNLVAVYKGAMKEVQSSRLALRLLLSAVGQKKSLQIAAPAFYDLAQNQAAESVGVALEALPYLNATKQLTNIPARHFCEELHTINDYESSLLDSVFMKEVGVRFPDLFDASAYEALFEKIRSNDECAKPVIQYAIHTLNAIKGIKERRARRRSGKR